MGHLRSSPLRTGDLPFWLPAASALATAVAFVLGSIGFWKYDVDHTGHGRVLDAMYHALQLFVLHGPALEPPSNVLLEIARWLAAAVLGLAATAAASRTLARGIQTPRLARASQHVVICGRGQVAAEFARSQRRRNPARTVVVIAAPDDTLLIEAARNLHAIVLEGDAVGQLGRARLSEARRLIALHEEDSVNVEIAVEATALSGQLRPDGHAPLECLARVADVDLRDSLRRNIPLRHPGCHVRFFDTFSDDARALLLHGLPLDHEGIREHDPRRVHLVIVGFGAMGRTVAVTAAQVGHFANRQPLRISVVDQAGANREIDLLFRHPAIRDVAHVEFHECPIQSPRARDLIAGWCSDPLLLTSVVVCLDNDAVAVDLAMRFLPSLGPKVPIALRMSRADGLTRLLTSEERPGVMGRFLPFGWFDEHSLRRLLEDDGREQLAQAAQVDFVELAAQHGRSGALDKAVEEWEVLADETYKESNRQQVDHMAIKLRAIDCEVVAFSDPRPAVALSAHEVELLSEMEHTRWVAERLLAGWIRADPPKNDVLRTNPNLVPWRELDEKTKNDGRAAVRSIPAMVRHVMEKKVCRRA